MMQDVGETLSSLSAKALDAYQRQNFTDALQHWSTIRSSFPDRPEGFWGSGEALRELKMFDEADYWLLAGIKKFPEHYLLRMGYGWSAAHRGNWSEAERRFASAINLTSENRAAHFAVALSLFRQGQYEQSRQALTPIRGDGRADTHDLLAQIKAKIGDGPGDVQLNGADSGAVLEEMAASVRLVIWDLDETFWSGTVIEGGITYSQQNHDIVVELARRGIMSSICSKNDFSQIETMLRDRGIWDYFIFPSIDWMAKGDRVRSIVDAVQLRPENILFIDDNPSNRAEVRQVNPDIQIADETLIPRILESKAFKGKDDSALTRLAQYKVLESKNKDALRLGSNNVDFLEQSDIRVFIDHDMVANAQRAIELINRTNQLNYTKSRLPEDPDEALRQFQDLMSKYYIAAGAIYASDRYGDYGCIGLYVMKISEGVGRQLDHFCFSCRTLGMEIERWLYQKLGQPQLRVVGEVLTDVKKIDPPITWVREVDSREQLSHDGAVTERLNTMVVRGGCDVRAIAHYLEGQFSSTFEEMNDIVRGIPVRTDHSVFLRHAMQGGTDAASVAPVGFLPEHFTSRIFSLQDDDANLVVLSLWSDGRYNLYRHKQSGIRVPIYFPSVPSSNYMEISPEIVSAVTNQDTAEALRYALDEFEYAGKISLEEYRETIRDFIAKLPPHIALCFIETPTGWYHKDSDERFSLERERVMNEINREEAAGRDNIFFVALEEHALERSDFLDFLHFSRPVYQRASVEIRNKFNAIRNRY